MHLTLRQLKVFQCAAKHLSFTRASETLHLTQPAVSMQIRQLEDAAGLALFDKHGKGLQLTEAGNEMLHYAEQVNQLLEDLDDTMAALKGVQQGHLRVSVATTANSFAPRLLAGFTRRYPGITLELDITNRTALIRQLAENRTDLVIMGQPPRDMDLEAEVMMENPLALIAAPDHPLAFRGDSVKLSDIANQPFVVRERESGTRMAMQRFFAEHDIELRVSMETTSNSTIKRAVEAGLGLGVVSIHTLELELETGRLVLLPVEDFPIRRQWFVVHNRQRRLPPVAQAFLKFMFSEEAAPLMRYQDIEMPEL